MKEKIVSLLNSKGGIIQFIKFGIVGVSNTLVSYLLNLLCLFLLDKYDVAYDCVIANTVAFVLSVLWSFYWNERFVFTEKQDSYQSNRLVRLLKMYLSYGFTGIILNNVLSLLWLSLLGIPNLIAPLTNSPIGVPSNYASNKKWMCQE